MEYSLLIATLISPLEKNKLSINLSVLVRERGGGGLTYSVDWGSCLFSRPAGEKLVHALDGHVKLEG